MTASPRAVPSPPAPSPSQALPRQRRTQVQRRASAEAALLAAARQIVARKGWVGMTLAEVGLAAGYSRGLAAHHFGSKPELMRALASHINTTFMQEFEGRDAKPDGLAGLLDFVDVYLGRRDPAWTNTRALLLLMAEAITDDSETGAILAAYNQSVQDWLARHFRAGIANGEMRPGVEPIPAAVVVLGVVRGVMLQGLLKDSRIDLKAVRKEVGDLIRFGFAAGAQASQSKEPAQSVRRR